MSTSNKIQIGFKDWTGEVRAASSLGDFSPLKPLRLEGYEEEARAYLQQYSVPQLLQGVEGDFVCGTGLVDLSDDDFQHSLWIRAVVKSFWKGLDESGVHHPTRGERIAVREYFFDHYLYANLVGIEGPIDVDRQSLLSDSERRANRMYHLDLDEERERLFIYEFTSSLMQGMANGRWEFPEANVRRFKGFSGEADRIYDLLSTHLLADEGNRDAFRFRWDEKDPSYPFEYRLNSLLGFGGKIHAHRGKVRVSCYSEDCGYYERKILQETNTSLDKLLG